MKLNDMQHHLESIYELDSKHQISDFLSSQEQIENYIKFHGYSNKETIFILENENNLQIAVFINSSIMRTLDQQEFDIAHLAEYCYALEGISHFLYIIHNSTYDRSVTQLEMELQAEIDKFVYLTINFNIDVIILHKLLFNEFSYRKGLSAENYERYKTASLFAEKYCFYLLKNYSIVKDSHVLKQELRKFYRITLRDKLHRIKKLH